MAMSKIKEKIEQLLEKRHLIPDEFWVRAENKERVLWILDHEDGTAGSYETSQERLGITQKGEILWGFSSGCSCWDGWQSENYCSTKSWKEFQITDFTSYRSSGSSANWESVSEKTLDDFLFLVSENHDPSKVVKLENAEVRRYMIKRVGYENIKDKVKATVLHVDGYNELLKFENGEMYVKVRDSSTDREYLLFVEGDHETCRSAIAWTFGLSEKEYNPIIES